MRLIQIIGYPLIITACQMHKISSTSQDPDIFLQHYVLANIYKKTEKLYYYGYLSDYNIFRIGGKWYYFPLSSAINGAEIIKDAQRFPHGNGKKEEYILDMDANRNLRFDKRNGDSDSREAQALDYIKERNFHLTYIKKIIDVNSNLK